MKLDVFDQGGNRLITRAQRVAIAQRPMQPAAQHAAAHRGRRAVEDAGERQLGFAGEALVQFEIAPRRGIHDQGPVVLLACEASADAAAPLSESRAHSRAARPPRRPRAACRRSRTRRGRAFGTVPERARGGFGSKCQAGRKRQGTLRRREPSGRDAIRHQQLRGTQPFELSSRAPRACDLHDAEAAGGQVEPRQAEAAAAPQTLASTLSRRSSSSASSVTVPGVTMRTTSRSMGPLFLPGSPRCSQIATDSPLRTSRAR